MVLAVAYLAVSLESNDMYEAAFFLLLFAQFAL